MIRRCMSSRLPIVRYVVEGVLLHYLVFATEFLFNTYGVTINGFYCDDMSIRFEKKDDIVNVVVLRSFVYLPMAIVVGIVEGYRLIYIDRNDFAFTPLEHGYGMKMRWTIRFFAIYGYYTVTHNLVQQTTSLVKTLAGRLRPHFIEVCNPAINLEACHVMGTYINNYTCLNTNESEVMEARLSFWSGHSALIFCAMTYVILYLQSRLAGACSSAIAVPVLQTFFLCIALFVSLSRIIDNHHHITDVIAGALFAVISTTLMGIFVGNVIGRKSVAYESTVAVDLDAEVIENSNNIDAATPKSTRKQSREYYHRKASHVHYIANNVVTPAHAHHSRPNTRRGSTISVIVMPDDDMSQTAL